jgi:phosphatidylglycerol:prolipoprotein diacylglycerol transferase
MIKLPILDPAIFRVGPIEVRWYGFMYALGFTLAWVLGRLRARQSWRAGPRP